MTLVCQSPSEPFQSQLFKDWQRVQGKFIIYSGHIISSTKAKEFNNKTQKQAQCREQGMRGPQSLLHTYLGPTIPSPHLPWDHIYLGSSSLPAPTPVRRHLPSTPNVLPLPHQALTSTQAGELLLCFPNSAHLSPHLSPLAS